MDIFNFTLKLTPNRINDELYDGFTFLYYFSTGVSPPFPVIEHHNIMPIHVLKTFFFFYDITHVTICTINYTNDRNV